MNETKQFKNLISKNKFGIFEQKKFFSKTASKWNNNETKEMNMVSAINNALDIALQTNPNAFVFGEDVAFGGVFR